MRFYFFRWASNTHDGTHLLWIHILFLMFFQLSFSHFFSLDMSLFCFFRLFSLHSLACAFFLSIFFLRVIVKCFSPRRGCARDSKAIQQFFLCNWRQRTSANHVKVLETLIDFFSSFIRSLSLTLVRSVLFLKFLLMCTWISFVVTLNSIVCCVRISFYLSP